MTTKHPRHSGRITRTLWHKPLSPFAFIVDVHTGENFFVHKSDIILQAGESLPVPGDHCSFELGQYNGRPVAVLVKKEAQS